MTAGAGRTWVALVHHPVYDRTRRVVATALTNLDLHDIARSARTYGLAGYLIVHPVEAQRDLAQRIMAHWSEGEGAGHNDFRRMAIERVRVVESIEDARAYVAAKAGEPPFVVASAARPGGRLVGFRELPARPILLLLGTGWGLTDEMLAGCDGRLPAIQARSDYNHLSVRSACAILLDRLYGDRED
jgi:hypothetical protein